MVMLATSTSSAEARPSSAVRRGDNIFVPCSFKTSRTDQIAAPMRDASHSGKNISPVRRVARKCLGRVSGKFNGNEEAATKRQSDGGIEWGIGVKCSVY